MSKLGLEKAKKPEIKSLTFVPSWRKQGDSRQTSASPLSTMLKPITVQITTNCEKFLREWEYQTTLLVS